MNANKIKIEKHGGEHFHPNHDLAADHCNTIEKTA